MFLAKYDRGGNQLWIQQFGGPGLDESSGIWPGDSDNVYITGRTASSLGGPNAGGSDVFVRKYAPNGNVLWTTQFGTPSDDAGTGIKWDGTGNFYVTGWTQGSLGGPNAGGEDGFVSRFDTNGNLLWTRQFGTPSRDEPRGVYTCGSGMIYVAGLTEGSLDAPNQGGLDAFVREYDPSGNLVHTDQFGTPADDAAFGVEFEGGNKGHVVGSTGGALAGFNAGSDDIFLRTYDGNLVCTETLQVGTPASDRAYDVGKLWGQGYYEIVGETKGSLVSPNQGMSDAFVQIGPPTIPKSGSAIADNSNSRSAFGPALTAHVAKNASYPCYESKVTGTTGAGGIGMIGSTATILAGTASDDTTVSVAWRTGNTSECSGASMLPGFGLASDVVNLTGIEAIDSQTRHGSIHTDTFVLQMSYDPTAILGMSESAAAQLGLITLGYLDLGADNIPNTADDRWSPDVLGNFGSSDYHFIGVGAWNNDTTLGDYGVDIGSHTVWAVVDHDSQFAVLGVVPEPATLLLLSLGGLALLRGRRRFGG